MLKAEVVCGKVTFAPVCEVVSGTDVLSASGEVTVTIRELEKVVRGKLVPVTTLEVGDTTVVSVTLRRIILHWVILLYR